jgi:hypothetical protein
MAKTIKRSRYTAEQRAAAQRRDQHATAIGEALFADAAAFGVRVAGLVDGQRGPKLLSYSPRNLALLMAQADERGMQLREVDTLNGWRARGRRVRKGSAGLRIVRPVGTDNAAQTDETAPAAVVAVATTEPADEQRPRFRMMSVFELSQTDPAETDVAVDGPAVVDPEPAATLYTALVRRAESAGYAVTCWPDDPTHGAPVEVDHEAQAIDVYADEPAGATLAALAEVVARLTGDARPGRRQADRPGGAVVALAI